MYIDHVGINTNDMEATLQFYCGILGMRLVRTTRTPDGRRHYNVEIGGGNAFAVFDGAELPTAGERQHVNHLALPVDTLEDAMQLLQIRFRRPGHGLNGRRDPRERAVPQAFASIGSATIVRQRFSGILPAPFWPAPSVWPGSSLPAPENVHLTRIRKPPPEPIGTAS